MNFNKPEDDQGASIKPAFPTIESENTAAKDENELSKEDGVIEAGFFSQPAQIVTAAEEVAGDDILSAVDEAEADETEVPLPPANDLERGEDQPSLERVEPGPSGWEMAKAIIREIVETVVLTLIIFFLIQSVIRNFRVDGHSMDPNLHHGEYLIVDKISYRLPFNWRLPQRGDVIVFEAPTQPGKDFVKRIIGLPGETVEIKQGQVFINGAPYDEPFGARLDRFSMGPQVVPEGEYFVMGDNRGNSNDSRNWGMLPFEEVVGRAWVSYWPPTSWGAIPNDAPTSSATLFGLFDQAEASP